MIQKASYTVNKKETPAPVDPLPPDFLKMIKCFKLFGAVLLLAGLVYWLSRNTVAAGGVVGAAAVVLTLYHLPFGIFVQLALLSLENAATFSENLSVSMVMGLVIFFSFLLRIMILKVVIPLPQKLIFIVTFWICISVWWCVDIEITVKFLRTFLSCVGFSFIFLNSIKDRKTFYLVLSGFVVGPLITSSMLMFGPVTYASFSAEEIGKALLHENSSPVALGRSIAFGFLIAFGVFWGKKKKLKLVVVPILMLFFLAIATKTQTRMALITAMSVPVFSLILCSERKNRLKYFFSAVVVGILGFLALNMVLKSDLMTEGAKARYGQEGLDRSKETRFAFWAEGLTAFTKRPLHGYGFVNSPFVLQRHKGRSVHNNFVAVVVELGLIGFALLGAIFMALYTKIRKVSDLRLKWLGMAMLLYPLISGLTSVNYSAKDFWYALTVAMICALLDDIERLKAADRSNA